MEYSLIFMLERAYNKINEVNNSERIKIKRPETYVSNRKMYISNFQEMSKIIDREPEKLKNFYYDQLKIDVSIIGSGEMKIDKRVNKIVIDKIYDSYIRKYVMCKSCKSLRTNIVKDNKLRLTYIVCKDCNSSNAIN